MIVPSTGSTCAGVCIAIAFFAIYTINGKGEKMCTLVKRDQPLEGFHPGVNTVLPKHRAEDIMRKNSLN